MFADIFLDTPEVININLILEVREIKHQLYLKYKNMIVTRLANVDKDERLNNFSTKGRLVFDYMLVIELGELMRYYIYLNENDVEFDVFSYFDTDKWLAKYRQKGIDIVYILKQYGINILNKTIS